MTRRFGPKGEISGNDEWCQKTSPNVGWLFVDVGFVPVLVLNWFEELRRLVPTD